MIKKSLILVFAALFALSMFACGKKQDTQAGYNVSVIRVAQQREDTYAAFIELIIKENSLIEKYLPDSVSVEWSVIGSHADKRDAIAAGQIDVGYLSPPIFIAAVENKLPLVLISDSTLTSYYVFTNKNTPKALEDIGLVDKISSSSSLGNNAHLSFMAACRERFGDAKRFDSNMIGMSVPDVIASASTSNDPAAAIMAYPFGLEAEVSEALEPILDLTPYAREYSLTGFYTTSQKFYDENTVLVEAFYKAEEDAVDVIFNNPEKAAEILQKYWDKYSIDEIKKILIEMPPRLEISESGYDKLANFMYEIELIPNQPKKFSELPNYADIPKSE